MNKTLPEDTPPIGRVMGRDHQVASGNRAAFTAELDRFQDEVQRALDALQGCEERMWTRLDYITENVYSINGAADVSEHSVRVLEGCTLLEKKAKTFGGKIMKKWKKIESMVEHANSIDSTERHRLHTLAIEEAKWGFHRELLVEEAKKEHSLVRGKGEVSIRGTMPLDVIPASDTGARGSNDNPRDPVTPTSVAEDHDMQDTLEVQIALAQSMQDQMILDDLRKGSQQSRGRAESHSSNKMARTDEGAHSRGRKAHKRSPTPHTRGEESESGSQTSYSTPKSRSMSPAASQANRDREMDTRREIGLKQEEMRITLSERRGRSQSRAHSVDSQSKKSSRPQSRVRRNYLDDARTQKERDGVASRAHSPAPWTKMDEKSSKRDDTPEPIPDQFEIRPGTLPSWFKGSAEGVDRQAIMDHARNNPAQVKRSGEIIAHAGHRLLDLESAAQAGTVLPSIGDLDAIARSFVMYFFGQPDEQSGWIRFNELAEGALEHNRAVVAGNVMRDRRGWIKGLTSIQCTTLAWRNRLFNLVNGKVGFKDTQIQCAPATTACIPSQAWKWEKCVGCGRPPHLLLQCPRVTIEHDLTLHEGYDETCWFCGEVGHTRSWCPTFFEVIDSTGSYTCELCGKKNSHLSALCNRHWTYNAHSSGGEHSSSSSSRPHP